MDKWYLPLYDNLDFVNLNPEVACNDQDTSSHQRSRYQYILPGSRLMSSQRSRYRRSRDQWKYKASERATDNRYVRKELKRVKTERDRLKKELYEARACLRTRDNQARGLVVQHKVDLVFLALQLFLVARIGFRAVSRVLGVLAENLGIERVPCPQTIINWVTRLSLARIQSAPALKAFPMERAGFSNGFIWMIDMSIALGTGKILTVLALNAHHHRLVADAPGFQNVHCIAVSVADSWTGEHIASFLERLISVMGRPAGYLKDSGSDLKKAIRLLDERGIGSPSIEDISHVIANLLKYWYCDHPMFEKFLSACGCVAGKLKQTILACLAPPKVHTKARFMNVHRLIRWAERLLELSPPGGAAKGSALSKLRACLDGLPQCRAFIKRFMADAMPLLECQKILKTRGLSHATLAECEQLIELIPTKGLSRGFLAYLHRQSDIARALGLLESGMTISSDPIESLYGLGKQHGTGEIKDADRIATRLPALCGIPTREDAKQVLGISVADQNKLTGCLNSLIKQRREVLPNPARLPTLDADQPRPHVELIPGAINRSKKQEIVQLSSPYPQGCGTAKTCQNGCQSP